MDEETRSKHAAIGRSIAADYFEQLEWLNLNLKQFGLNMRQFIDMSKAERFTMSEINDREYMLEKFSIWQEMFEESIPDYIYIQGLVDDKSILKISEYAVKYKLSVQEMMYNTKGLSKRLWSDVSETMLGILYEGG